MRFYGVILLFVVIGFTDQIQSQLMCYSCDDCDVMNQKNVRLETCEMELEALVAAADNESSDTVLPETIAPDTTAPETATEFMDRLEEDRTEETYVITENIQEENTVEDDDNLATDVTTEFLEETTTDFPLKSLVKRDAGPISYCYKFLARSEAKRQKRSRGCVKAHSTEHACALITALSDDVAGTCELCTEDKCNSAGIKNWSLFAVVLGFLMCYVRI